MLGPDRAGTSLLVTLGRTVPPMSRCRRRGSAVPVPLHQLRHAHAVEMAREGVPPNGDRARPKHTSRFAESPALSAGGERAGEEPARPSLSARYRRP